MRRLLAIAIPAVVLLGAPAAAPAKGIVSAKVCGADGCRTVHPTEEGMLGGGAPADSPARPEPFVRIVVRVGVPDHIEPIRLLFLPRSELLLGDDGGTWMVPMARAELHAIARRVKPFAASELPTSVPLGDAAARAGSRGALAPEIVQAPSAAAATASDGLAGWWLALPGAAIVLVAGFVLARRRRREPPAAAARAIG